MFHLQGGICHISGQTYVLLAMRVQCVTQHLGWPLLLLQLINYWYKSNIVLIQIIAVLCQ